MCDYSLCGIPHRLAIEGEELIVYRFSTGSMGLASLPHVRARKPTDGNGQGWTFWQHLRNCFAHQGESAIVPAVCIPPGARLMLRDIPVRWQRRYRVSAEETVVFTQLSAEANTYRDAISFQSGARVRLQELCEGMSVEVLSLSENVEPLSQVMSSARLL